MSAPWNHLKQFQFKALTRNFIVASKLKKAERSTEKKVQRTTVKGPEKDADKGVKLEDSEVFWGNELIPQQFLKESPFPDPVRNTEREYFLSLRDPNRGKVGPFDSKFYSKKHGVSIDLQAWLHWDMNINDNEEIALWSKQRTWNMLKEDQRYREDRVKAVGHELGAAHFIVARGGAVKFLGREHWFVKDKKGGNSLPRNFVNDIFVEAIDLSNTLMTYVAFDNLENLSNLRYLKLNNSPHIDDWCLARLHRLAHSLEFLDIQNCPGITENGLSLLYNLPKLKGLKISNLTGVKNLGLISILLEEKLPNLTILGVEDKDVNPPTSLARGERKLVRGLLGYMEPDIDSIEVEVKNQERDNDELKGRVRIVD
ncbi:unnamed protein product [Lymnaea stagnalis]|uniref:ATP synthase subunit s-like protein n=1 Tax=Lymnaea stagnalis TaxID=6523 RepID=A0AAV2HS94_LYMST